METCTLHTKRTGPIGTPRSSMRCLEDRGPEKKQARKRICDFRGPAHDQPRRRLGTILTRDA